MRLVWKLVACVVRPGLAGPELLVVDHPASGTHLPIGTLVDGEAQEAGLLRELFEASGLADVEVVRTLSSWERHTLVHGAAAEQRWQVIELRPTELVAEEWAHLTDRGVMRCHWLSLDMFALDTLHPSYGTFVELLIATREA